MPVQAVANNMAIPFKVPVLEGLTIMECQCIGGHIPFMHIQSLAKGGQKRIHGPCVNVPASLEPMALILPRIPQSLKLTLIKLKRKLSYDSYYKFDYIRPQVVMEALMYLKANHAYYKNVVIDYKWFDNFQKGDYKSLIDPEVMESMECSVPCAESDPDFMECSEAKEKNDSNEEDDSVNDKEKNDSNEEDDSVNSDDEFEECQLAANKNGQVTVDPSPTCVQINNIDDIFCIAPSEGKIPKLMLMDDDFEVTCFPDYFPNGHGGLYCPERVQKIDIRQYANQRLLNVDGRFAQNYEYIFSFQYGSELKQLNGAAATAIRMTKGNSSFSASDLLDKTFMSNLVKIDSAYQYMSKVRGTPAYWQQNLYDTLGMMKVLGKPTWFLTLSPAEFLWTEFVQAVGVRNGKVFTEEDVRNMKWAEKAEYLRNNPVTTVQMFHHRLTSFFNTYLKSKAHPIGEITDHLIKIEFQARGSPHAHCLIWVKDAPVTNIDDDETICQFIDKYCLGRIPEEGNCTCLFPDDISFEDVTALATKLQTHSHSSYCRHHKNAPCRFKFPKPPSAKTILSHPPTDVDEDQEKERRDIFKRINEELEKDMTCSLKNLLQRCSISEDKYHSLLEILPSGTNIILKREPQDVNTNNYNPKISSLWGANMDLQFVVNPYSAVTYILSYVMKAEKGMSDIIKRVASEYAQEGIRQQMKNITKAFSGKREVSVQEAVYRVLSIPLFTKSRTVVFINSNHFESRICMPKSRKELEELPDDSKDIFTTSIHDRYVLRPDELEDMCLWEFASKYIAVRYSTSKCLKNERIKLKKNANNGKEEYMMKRSKFAVIRTRNHKKGTENYFYSQLLLFYPYRDEKDFGKGFTSVEEHYKAVHKTIKENAEPFNMFQDEVDEALNEYENTEKSPEIDDQQNIFPVNKEDREPNERTASLTAQFTAEAKKDTITLAEYCYHMRNLNKEQRQVVDYNRRYVKWQIQEMKAGKSPPGYKIFLCGPGGTGKSHVIKLINRDTRYLYSATNTTDPANKIDSTRCPEKPTTLLTAFTGTAAFNINGGTLHSTLQLHIQNLSAEKRNCLETQLCQLQLMTIDEISMVGGRHFNMIDSRLSILKDTKTDEHNFGNVNMLLVGDLYQLPPVCATPIYKYPDINSICDMQDLLWHDFKLHELTQIMRQKDREFALLLNSLRESPPEPDSFEENLLLKHVITVQ